MHAATGVIPNARLYEPENAAEAFAAGQAAERERCAKLAEEYATWGGSNFCAWFTKLAAAIRA